jgi:hypothetical protein
VLHAVLNPCISLLTWQIVVRGIPWAYTWKELKDMFAEIGEVERADVVYGEDGRSRVGGGPRHHCSAQTTRLSYETRTAAAQIVRHIEIASCGSQCRRAAMHATHLRMLHACLACP